MKFWKTKTLKKVGKIMYIKINMKHIQQRVLWNEMKRNSLAENIENIKPEYTQDCQN